MPVVYNESDESMRFDSKCTAEDVIIAILQNKNPEQRSILNLSCNISKNMIKAYEIGSLLHDYVAFTFNKLELD